MNDFITDCMEEEAFSGYVAAMLWSMVQVDRPSSSTSGGQSEGSAVCVVDAAAVATVEGPPALVDFFIIAIHAEEDVQLRQLFLVSFVSGSVL